jgi:phage terminase large subunit
VSKLAAAAERIKRWRHDAILFVREVFGVEPDEWQKEGLRAWTSEDPKDKRVAMKACAGPGKSAELAWFGWHALTCQGEKGQHPNGFAVSITADNLRDGLWKELAVWRNRSDFLKAAFEWQKEQIFAKDHPETWWLRARSFSKSADPEAQGRTLSGLHSPYIFYLVDEAGDMPPSVGRSIEQGLGNCKWGKAGLSGNPTNLAGLLYQASVDQAHLWHIIEITGDPEDPRRSPRIPIKWAQEQIDLYGRDNPWVMAFILGKFPPSSLNALFGPDEVRESMRRGARIEDYQFAQKRLGIDVARFGDDKTVIQPRWGLNARYEPQIMRGARSEEIAGRIALVKSKWDSEVELIDSTGGYSGGAEDASRLGGINLVPVNSSSNAFDARYFNRRSEMYFLFSQWVKNGGCLPYIPLLVPQLTAVTYYFDKGRLRVLEKEQIKKALNGASPDEADALALTFALPDMPGQMGFPDNMLQRKGSFVDFDYDPLAA